MAGNILSRGNAVILLACLTMLLTGAMEAMKGFLPAHFEQYYGFAASGSGLIFAASFGGLMLANLSAGRVLQRIDWKSVFVWMMLGFAAAWGLLWLLSPPHIVHWIAIFFMIGFANGIGVMICNMLGPVMNPRHAVKVLGRIHFCFGSGLIIGPLLYARLDPASAALSGSQTFGWGAVFAAYTVLALALLVLAWRLHWPKIGQQADAADRSPVEQPVVAAPKRTRMLLLLGVLYFCYVGAESGLTVWYITLLTTYYQMDMSGASLLYAIGFALFTCMRLLADRIVGRLGEARTLRLIAIAGMGCLLWSHLMPGLLGAGGYLIFLLSIAIVFPLLTAYSARQLGTAAVSRMGILLALGFAGGAFSSWCIGWLQGVFDIRIAFATITLLFAGFCVTLLRLLAVQGASQRKEEKH